MADISINAANIRQGLSKLERMSQRAAVTSFNRTATAVQRAAAREIGQELSVAQKEVIDTLSIRHATTAKLDAQVVATGKRIPLVKFVSQAELNRFPFRNKSGISYRIGRRGTKRLKSGFLVKLGSGHLGVFMRRGKKRVPIDEKFGPSTVLIFTRQKVQAVLKAVIVERFAKEFAQNFRFFSRAA